MYLSAMCEASHPVTTIDGAHGLSTSVAARPAGATDLDENETQGPSTSLGMTELGKESEQQIPGFQAGLVFVPPAIWGQGDVSVETGGDRSGEDVPEVDGMM